MVNERPVPQNPRGSVTAPASITSTPSAASTSGAATTPAWLLPLGEMTRHSGATGTCPHCRPRSPERVRALVEAGRILLIRSRSILADARGYIGHTPGCQDG